MALKPMEQLNIRAEEERVRLQSGEKPKSRFTSRLQRTAVRLLAGFFALMLCLTLVSRAAEGVTVARVKTQRPKTGILTQRVDLSGTIEPLGDLDLTLPAGIQVTSIRAQAGQRVEPGDPLLELDGAGLDRTMEKLRNDIRLLDLKIQNALSGNSGDDTEAILAAQQALADAQEDYDRLVNSRERAEGRSEEDLLTAQADYDKALEDLEKAEKKALENLVKEAEEKVKGAQKDLEAVQEAAQSAIESAQASLTAAQDSAKAFSEPYYNSVRNLKTAKERLQKAQAELQELQDSGTATEAQLQAAQEKVDAAQAEVDAANWSMESYNYKGDLAVTRAAEELAKVTERQGEKVKKAEQALEEAKAELEKVKKESDVSEEALVVSARSALEGTERALKTAQRGVEDTDVATDEQIFTAGRAVEAAQRAVEQAQRKAEENRLSAAKDQRGREIERLGYESERREQARTLAELERVAAGGGVLTAPIAGTVQSILTETGRTQDGVSVATLSRSDQGFQLEAATDEKSAEKLSLGDQGKVTYHQDGKAREAVGVVSAIGAADDKGQVKVTVTLPEGSYPAGVSAKLELSKRSEQYGACLPLGALRSDGDKDYVLVLQEKNTVMGIEQTVVRVEVTVLDRDSESMAVESSLMGTEQVVTSSSKPIGEGDRVRLETGDK